MVPKSKNIFDFLESEKNDFSQCPDSYIISNLYYVSFSNALALIENNPDEKRREELYNQNEWLNEVIPDSTQVDVLNFDQIKKYLSEYGDLKSCDAFFYSSCLERKCFLVEFKRASRSELLPFIEPMSNSQDAIIKKVRASCEILQKVSFSTDVTEDNLIGRTHIIVVYDGKKDTASAISVHSQLPSKKHTSRDSGKQKHASRQKTVGFSSKKTINEPTKRFAEYVHTKLGFCEVSKHDLPGSAFPESDPRYSSFMTASDFKKSVASLFKKWDWGEYVPYFDSRRRQGQDMTKEDESKELATV